MAVENGGKKPRELHCSFCGKNQHEVRKLIGGDSVFVCDECVELCNDIIRSDTSGEQENAQVAKPSFLKPTERHTSNNS